jgi:hypothetical protein
MDRAELRAALLAALRLAEQQRAAATDVDASLQAYERVRTYRGLLEDLRNGLLQPDDVAALLQAHRGQP